MGTSLNVRYSDYSSWYISLPFSNPYAHPNPKQRCEMTKFRVFGGREPRRLIVKVFTYVNVLLCPRFTFVLVLTVLTKISESRVPQEAFTT